MPPLLFGDIWQMTMIIKHNDTYYIPYAQTKSEYSMKRGRLSVTKLTKRALYAIGTAIMNKYGMQHFCCEGPTCLCFSEGDQAAKTIEKQKGKTAFSVFA